MRPATLDETRLPRPGDVVAERFRLEDVRGTGGMGIVFGATHLGLERAVAIKVLHPGLANPVHVQRFFREARAAGSLSNPHVVQVLDVGQLDDGAPFMVMELLEGCDLSTLLRHRGRIPIPDAVSYVLQAANGMEAAHAAGIVHRDLKPGNLFLARQPDGTDVVKVLDFGISKLDALEREATLTRTHDLIGSPQYMAPEQLRTPQDVDHLADVWSMGAILFRLISGEPLFDRAGPALLAAVLMDTPRRLRSVMPSVPLALDDVVARCLERDKERRYGSMRELAEALLPFRDPSYRAVTEGEPPPRTITPSSSGPHGLYPAYSPAVVAGGAPLPPGRAPAHASVAPPPPPWPTAAPESTAHEPTAHTATIVSPPRRRGIGLPIGLAAIALAMIVVLSVALARSRPPPLAAVRGSLPTYVRALAFGARVGARPGAPEPAPSPGSVAPDTTVVPAPSTSIAPLRPRPRPGRNDGAVYDDRL